jgi:hypothetical protein
MALAAIGKLSDTLEDRSLRIDLQRKKKTDAVQRFPRKGPTLKALQTEMAALQRQCVRWVTDHQLTLSTTEPGELAELSDRANDNWYSLLSIAEVIGGDWPQKARQAAVTIAGTETDSETIGVLLLADIYEIFEQQQTEKTSSKDLCESLEVLEERPWATWRKGKPISTNQLARMLKGFHVVSQTIRLGTVTAKGYFREQFTESWDRYSVLLSKNHDLKGNIVTTPMDKGQTHDFQKVTDPPCYVSKNGPFANTGAGCDGVTAQNPENRDEHTQPDLLDPKQAGASVDI